MPTFGICDVCILYILVNVSTYYEHNISWGLVNGVDENESEKLTCVYSQMDANPKSRFALIISRC